jgi:hypothetical protein
MDPYAGGMLSESPYVRKRPVAGRVVAVLRAEMKNRGLQCITPPSRAVKVHEVHELIVTEDPKAGPGATVTDVCYIAFVEIEKGGVLLAGDEVRIAGRLVGVLAGFDDTHMPNHQNILLSAQKAATGLQLGVQLEQEVVFEAIGKESGR